VSQRLISRAEKKGRVAAVEILINNARVRDLILDPARTADIRRVLDESNDLGMQSFDKSLLELCAAKQISEKEALAQCCNPRDFQLRLKGIVAGDWSNVGPSKSSFNEFSVDKIEIQGFESVKKKA
jgi:twitching motility protein PilT